MDQEAGAHGGQGRLAEAAGDDDGLAALGVAAEVFGEAVARHAAADQRLQFGIVTQPQLGAGPDDGHVDVRRHLGRVEAVVERDALALQVGRDRREDPIVGAGDLGPVRGQDRGQGAHAGAGDAKKVRAHSGPIDPVPRLGAYSLKAPLSA